MKISKFLARRHRTEKEFHDALAKKTDVTSLDTSRLFTSKTAPESRYAYSQMGTLKGKKVLDLGCGNGEAAVHFAKKGARVYAVDISPEMIRLVKKLAKQNGLGKSISASVMLAERLKFPSNYFDAVFGRGVLHHVSINPALHEVKRVLKDGSVGVFIEPLMHNPVINIYRKLAKEVRTPDEKPINYFKIANMSRVGFQEVSHREFQLATLLIFLWYFLIKRVSPNSERYWDKLIDDGRKMQKPFALLKKIDDFLFWLIPYLRQFAWYSVIVLRK